ncbi:MAG: hypothetical protein AB1492_03190 [Bacillota bacterium]
MRKELPLLLTFVTALTVVVFRMTQWGWDTKFLQTFSLAFTTTGVAAMFVGAINIFRIHLGHIRRRKEGWIFSVVALACLVFYTLLGWRTTNQGVTYKWIFDAIWTPINSTIFSLLIFYVASAAYRAFRIRTKEATVLLLCGITVMLTRVALGKMIWSEIPNAGNWLLRVPASAAFRAIDLGGYIGMFAVSLRLLLGLERSHLGGLGGSMH